MSPINDTGLGWQVLTSKRPAGSLWGGANKAKELAQATK